MKIGRAVASAIMLAALTTSLTATAQAGNAPIAAEVRADQPSATINR